MSERYKLSHRYLRKRNLSFTFIKDQSGPLSKNHIAPLPHYILRCIIYTYTLHTDAFLLCGSIINILNQLLGLLLIYK